MTIMMIFMGIGGALDVPSIGLIGLLAWVPIPWIAIALLVKRIRDLDKPLWYIALAFVPLANFYLFILVLFVDGTQGPNQYGPSPKGL